MNYKKNIDTAERLFGKLIIESINNNANKNLIYETVGKNGKNYAIIHEDAFFRLKVLEEGEYKQIGGEENRSKFQHKIYNESLKQLNNIINEQQYFIKVDEPLGAVVGNELSVDDIESEDGLDTDLEDNSEDIDVDVEAEDGEAASVAGKAASIVRDGEESDVKNVLNSIAAAVEDNSIPDDSKEKLKSALGESIEKPKTYKTKKGIQFYKDFFSGYNAEFENNDNEGMEGGESMSEARSEIDEPVKGQHNNPVNTDSVIDVNETASQIEDDKMGENNRPVNTDSIIEEKYEIIESFSKIAFLQNLDESITAPYGGVKNDPNLSDGKDVNKPFNKSPENNSIGVYEYSDENDTPFSDDKAKNLTKPPKAELKKGDDPISEDVDKIWEEMSDKQSDEIISENELNLYESYTSSNFAPKKIKKFLIKKNKSFQ